VRFSSILIGSSGVAPMYVVIYIVYISIYKTE
jgi:hypothetical protein